MKSATSPALAILATLSLVGCQSQSALSPSTPVETANASASPSAASPPPATWPGATSAADARILFQRATPDGATYLDLITLATGEVFRFPDQGHQLYANSVAWSPDGLSLIGPIDVAQADGSTPQLLGLYPVDGVDRPHELTHPPRDTPGGPGQCGAAAPSDEPGGTSCTSVFDREATWSPDGQHIAFTRSLGPESRWVVGVVSVEGNDPERILADGSRPAWSPDGRQLVYQVYQPSGSGTPDEGVTILDPGSGDRRLLWPGFADLLAWTAEGILATTSGWPDCGLVCLIAPEDGSIRQIDVPTTDPPTTEVADLDVHPNGHTALMTLVGERDLDIWAVDLRTGDWEPLTDTPDLDRGATWSPDGRLIAFARAPIDTLRPSIWVMDADGSDAHRVTEPPAEGGDDLPSWQPVVGPLDLPVDTGPPTASPSPSPSIGRIVLVVRHPEGIGRVEGEARCEPRGDGGTDIHAYELGGKTAGAVFRLEADGSIGLLDVTAGGVNAMSGKGWDIAPPLVVVDAGSGGAGGRLVFSDLPSSMGDAATLSGELSWSCRP